MDSASWRRIATFGGATCSQRSSGDSRDSLANHVAERTSDRSDGAAMGDIGVRLLLDADGGFAFGGSGKRLDWRGIRRWGAQTSHVDWILAGGLDPQNVATAICESGAKAVDVAGGTEREKGVKDPQRIEQFVAAALRQWEATD
ncbi:MAG: hypothetical protein R3C05_05370 [Pirellulaceae bacterium]